MIDRAIAAIASSTSTSTRTAPIEDLIRRALPRIRLLPLSNLLLLPTPLTLLARSLLLTKAPLRLLAPPPRVLQLLLTTLCGRRPLRLLTGLPLLRLLHLPLCGTLLALPPVLRQPLLGDLTQLTLLRKPL